MYFIFASIFALVFAASFAVASPMPTPHDGPTPYAGPTHIDTREPGSTILKRETSYGNPDLVVDQGDRYKLNFGSRDGHSNACPGHFICYIPKRGDRHGDVSLGNPDDFVWEGDRFRVNYGSTSGHSNACDGHFICYLPA